MSKISRVISTAFGASLIAMASPAAATTVIDGSCVSVLDSAGCLFEGNVNSSPGGPNGYLAAQDAYNLYNDTHPSANPDIRLSAITASDDADFGTFGSITGDAMQSGTWSLPGFDVNFLAVKAGNFFVLYQFASPISSGNWDTDDIPPGNKDLSHLVFFGNRSPIPEPATWAMLIFGFGAIGTALRRRKTKVTVRYA